mgnify:CR=1 FL=1
MSSGNQEGEGLRGVAPTHTRDKLQAILGNFDPFEVEMKEGTRRRREFDEERLRELAEELARLQHEGRCHVLLTTPPDT